MDLISLLNDKAIKAKAKTEAICDLLLKNKVSTKDLAALADKLKDPAKATCIEALEFATKQKPAVIDVSGFRFVTASLTSKAPRVKWESAKVIGNTAHLFKDELDEPIKNLLGNTEGEGTVVRWSAAFALSEIVKLKTRYNKTLVPAIESIGNSEEKNSIKKIYLDAVKKISQ